MQTVLWLSGINRDVVSVVILNMNIYVVPWWLCKEKLLLPNATVPRFSSVAMSIGEYQVPVSCKYGNSAWLTLCAQII